MMTKIMITGVSIAVVGLTLETILCNHDHDYHNNGGK